MNNTFRLFAAAVVSVAGLSGCASALNVGSSGYSCSGMPEGVRCMGARDVYTATNNADHVGPTDRVVKTEKQSDAAVQKTMTGAFPRGVEDLTPITAAAVPVRSPARVMRVWIAPWEDEDGYLHASEFVFAEIEGRRWSIGSQSFSDGSATSKPLKTGNSVSRDRAVSPLRGSSGGK